jgi:hypothetical protein
MKNAKNKLSNEQIEIRQLRQTNTDHLPESVAMDLLSQKGRRMTNRERKVLMTARSREFISTAERKPASEKLARKMPGFTLAQIGKWQHRAEKKRRGVQRKYSAAIGLQAASGNPNPVIERLIAGLNLRAAQIDLFLDAAAEELGTRENLVIGNIGAADLLFVPALRASFFWSNGELHWCRLGSVPSEISPTYATR